MDKLNIKTPIYQMMLPPFVPEVPSIKQVDMVICRETKVYAQGRLIALYKKAEFDTANVRAACLTANFNRYERLSGLETETLNINASPRNGLRTNKCDKTKFHREDPERHQIFLDIARPIAKEYRINFPKAYASQVRMTHVGAKRVEETYRIAGTPFTSGVINKDTALGFHRDTANTADGISCMLILKRGVAGGELILPELNIGFACQDDYILLFDGQKYIHGVTPILQPANGKGYRYTIVYYNSSAMSLCLPPEAELEYYRQQLEKATERNYQKSKKR
jgi:hypothetical protein